MSAVSFLRSFKSAIDSPSVAKLLKSVNSAHTNLMGYRQLGLRFDDLVQEENEYVSEALRRLSPADFHARTFRIKRALFLSGQDKVLDVSEQTTDAQDVPYLRPIIAQVEEEALTKLEFDNLSKIPAALLKRNRI